MRGIPFQAQESCLTLSCFSLPDPMSLSEGVFPARSRVCRQDLERSALETWERKNSPQTHCGVGWGGPLEIASCEIPVGLLSEPQKPHEARARTRLRQMVGLGRDGCLQGVPLLKDVAHQRGGPGGTMLGPGKRVWYHKFCLS